VDAGRANRTAALSVAGCQLRSSQGAQESNNSEAPIFEFRTHVYYIQNCSRFNSGAACDPGGADDGGQPIPTLVRYQLQPDPVGGALSMKNLVPLVEGVEALNIMFGVDGIDPATPNPDLTQEATYEFAPDGVVDRFVVPPGNVHELFWQHVAAVRVSVLIRSPDMIPNHVDAVDLDLNNPDNKTYDLGWMSAEIPCNWRSPAKPSPAIPTPVATSATSIRSPPSCATAPAAPAGRRGDPNSRPAPGHRLLRSPPCTRNNGVWCWSSA